MRHSRKQTARRMRSRPFRSRKLELSKNLAWATLKNMLSTESRDAVLGGNAQRFWSLKLRR